MVSVSINGFNMARFGFYLQKREISTPEPKTNYIEIPGRNGDLDLTGIFGQTFFNNRNVNLDFVGIYRNRSTFEEILTQVQMAFNGIYGSITIDEHGVAKVYKGRMTVGDSSANGKEYVVNISMKAEPYIEFYKEFCNVKAENMEPMEFDADYGDHEIIGGNIAVNSPGAVTGQVILNDLTFSVTPNTSQVLTEEQIDEILKHGNTIQASTNTGGDVQIILNLGWKSM